LTPLQDHLLQAVVDPIGNGVRRWQWQSIADDSEATTAEDTLEASVGDLRGALYVGRQGHGYYNEQSSNSGRSRTHKPTVDMPVETSTLESSSNGVLSLLTIEPTLYESDTSADELALGMSASVPLPPNRLKGGPEKCHSKPDRKRHSKASVASSSEVPYPLCKYLVENFAGLLTNQLPVIVKWPTLFM
jgi:hypothetical protein